jgi:hypothetical protein
MKLAYSLISCVIAVTYVAAQKTAPVWGQCCGAGYVYFSAVVRDLHLNVALHLDILALQYALVLPGASS